MGFFQMVLDAIVAAQYHRTSQADHFLGFYFQGPFGVGIAVQIEKALDDLVVLRQYALIHPATIVIEFFQ
jgi:hypothetical protein